jgi:hypothetical protein
MQHADDRDAIGHHFVEDHIVLNGIRPYGHCPIGFNLAGKDRHRPDPDIGRSRKRTLKPMEAAVEVTATSRTPPTFLDPTPIFIGPRSPTTTTRPRPPNGPFSGCAQRRPLQPVVRRCASHPVILVSPCSMRSSPPRGHRRGSCLLTLYLACTPLDQ